MAAAQQPQGQRPERPRMTPEEYRAKQQEFITRHAELTPEESDAFFPLYFELQNKKHFYDYVFVKPLFDSQSKVNFSNSFPAETIREMKKKKLIDHNVMAAGGITSKNILLVKELGFGGAVIMSDLWEKFDAQNDYNYLKVINYFKQLKKMVD